MAKFTVVRVDDWTVLYVDGVLDCENHSLDYPYALARHGVDIETKWAENMVDPIGGGWAVPMLLEDVTFDD